ncbi:MAG: hypothetical protein ACKVY0_26985 [Prosthecobacter sp.]|uniref:hypothetical protein n=1 Tax=Prosthecobacter sp. TaxID=1965333 RepID=UPI003902FEB2
MKITRRTEAGFVNSAYLHLLLALTAISVVMVGSWPVRFGVLTVAGALWLAVFIADRLMRFKPGDHVKVQFGPHAGASGRIIGLLPGGRGVQVALAGDGVELIVDFYGGYQLVRLKQPVHAPTMAAHTPPNSR